MGVVAVSKKITDNIMGLVQNVYFVCIDTLHHPYLVGTIIIGIFKWRKKGIKWLNNLDI